MYSFLISVALVATFTTAARLDNTYLPARGSSGSGAGFVSTPFGGGGGGGGGAGRYTGGGGTGSYSGGGTGSYSGGGSGSYSGGGAPSGPFIPIISYENNPNQGDGSYSYSYETGNGIKAQESGRQSSAPGPEGPGTAAEGSYSYKGPDGQTYTITYTADENGFRPQGAHLPTPPPIPPEILKSLQQQGITSDGAGGYTGGRGGGDGAYNDGASGYGGSSGGFSSGGTGGGFQRRPTQSFSPDTGYQYK